MDYTGGKTFQESVINGMKYLKDKLNMDDIVMIHYGAAPFSSQHIIQDGIEKCKKYGMSVSCTPCFQLMGSNDGNGKKVNNGLTEINKCKFVVLNHLDMVIWSIFMKELKTMDCLRR